MDYKTGPHSVVKTDGMESERGKQDFGRLTLKDMVSRL